MTDYITPEAAEEIMAREFPAGYLAKAHTRTALGDLVTAYGPLEAHHIAALTTHLESGQTFTELTGGFGNDLKAIRHTHHRLAQLLAGGMDETLAAKLCNYTVNRVSILKSDPAFKELLAYYSGAVEDAFVDFNHAAAELSNDMLGRLQQILDETPEKFNPRETMEAIKVLRDYSGNAPVAKTLNVNVNAQLGERLRAARERSNALLRAPDNGVI